jgi:hypothetical protein
VSSLPRPAAPHRAAQTWPFPASTATLAPVPSLEEIACAAIEPSLKDFNKRAVIPLGCRTEHVYASMVEFVSFLSFINAQLHTRSLARLESMLMPANFSSMVGEFMSATIPKHCKSVVKNRYHNGHPDLIPAGAHPKDALQHHHIGIEIKGSRYTSGWQGHNPEDTWLMVFVFDSSRPEDSLKNVEPKPFRFVAVVGAQLKKEDWNYSGRSETSRRTITAGVSKSGFVKMMDNWIYKAPV